MKLQVIFESRARERFTGTCYKCRLHYHTLYWLCSRKIRFEGNLAFYIESIRVSFTHVSFPAKIPCSCWKNIEARLKISIPATSVPGEGVKRLLPSLRDVTPASPSKNLPPVVTISDSQLSLILLMPCFRAPKIQTSIPFAGERKAGGNNS